MEDPVLFMELKVYVFYYSYSEEFQLTFSCQFGFQDYPFDSHECYMEYGDNIWNTSYITFSNSIIIYENRTNKSFEDDPIILNHLPFEIQLSREHLSSKHLHSFM